MTKPGQEPKKKKSLKRELIEWGIIVGIIGLLYVTGLHTVVLGGIQSIILKTGLIKPNTHSKKDFGITGYNFRLIDQAGRVVEGSSLKGKVVFLNFWATWCPPCVAEMPDINRLYENVKDKDFVFVMLSVDEDFNKAKRFAEKRGFSLPIYQAASGIPDVFSGNVVPTTYVIAPNGRIVLKREGMAEYNTQTFRDFLTSLLKKNE